jgi:hypothetical protein
MSKLRAYEFTFVEPSCDNPTQQVIVAAYTVSHAQRVAAEHIKSMGWSDIVIQGLCYEGAEEISSGTILLANVEAARGRG